MNTLTRNDIKIQIKKVKATNIWIDPEFQKEQIENENLLHSKAESEIIVCETYILLNKETVLLTFHPKNEAEIETYLQEINKQIDFIENNNEKIQNSMYEAVLHIKNTYWLDAYEKPYTIDSIQTKAKEIKEVNFKDKNNYSIIYDDDNIFSGHNIEVSMQNNIILDISICG